MPQAGNITVKKNNGTTDIVWSLINPAGGPGFGALWRSDTVLGPRAVKPTFTFSVRPNGPKTAQRCIGEVVFPEAYLDANGQTRIANRSSIKLDAIIVDAMDQSILDELVAQATNLFKDALIQTCLKQGANAT